jgi:hypothetical protein
MQHAVQHNRSHRNYLTLEPSIFINVKIQQQAAQLLGPIVKSQSSCSTGQALQSNRNVILSADWTSMTDVSGQYEVGEVIVDN